MRKENFKKRNYILICNNQDKYPFNVYIRVSSTIVLQIRINLPVSLNKLSFKYFLTTFDLLSNLNLYIHVCYKIKSMSFTEKSSISILIKFSIGVN